MKGKVTGYITITKPFLTDNDSLEHTSSFSICYSDSLNELVIHHLL